MREFRKSGGGDRLDDKLRKQLIVFAIVFLVMVALMVFHLVRDHLNPLWILVGLVPGLGIGFLLSRTKVLQWDESQGLIVGTADVVGTVILVAYLLFQLSRTSIVGLHMENADLISLVSLAVTAGTMLGRLMFTLRNIRDVLGDSTGPVTR